ncbi:MAG: alanine racemase [Actinomycetes bacterium]
MGRPSTVDVDLAALTANAAALVAASDGAQLCAVVKADGYGHGAVTAARAALAGGATWLAVAMVEEGLELRSSGLTAPVLVLSEAPTDMVPAAVEGDLTLTVYSERSVDEAAAAGPATVHLKIDTGMHRVGADPADAVALARRVLAAGLTLGGTFTHLARADEPDEPLTAAQLATFEQVLADLSAAGIDPGLRHAANSAGLLLHPAARYDMVRAGIALYGIPPAADLEGTGHVAALVPALSLSSEVTAVRPLAAGEGVNYGHRWVAGHDTVVAVVPVGYADGVRRDYGLRGGEVLIGGVRRPVRGVVTMDQLVVEVGDGPPVARGEEVVLLGRQGDERVAATEWADRLDTIGYEVVCAFSARLPRTSA